MKHKILQQKRTFVCLKKHSFSSQSSVKFKLKPMCYEDNWKTLKLKLFMAQKLAQHTIFLSSQFSFHDTSELFPILDYCLGTYRRI